MKMIVTHKGADFDGIASLVAAGILNPGFSLHMPGSPEKNVREYLEKESFPAKLCSYRKIRYKKLEELIVVDTGYLHRLGKIKDLITEDTRIFIYDHHPKSEMDIKSHKTVHKSWGATVTIFLKEIVRKKIKLTAGQATLFLLGIYEDTGCLTYPLTSPHDMEAAAYLLKQGAELSKISEYAIHHMDEDQVHLLDKLLNNKVFISLKPDKILITSTEIDDYVEELSVVVGKIMDIVNPDALFSIFKIKDQIICIARSGSKNIDVGQVISRLGGGGHMSAASVKFDVRDKTLSQLKSDIKKIIFERGKNTFSRGYVRIIPYNHTVERAYHTLNHLNLRYAPVGNEKGNIYGLVLKDELAKARKHGMKSHLVDEFITEKVPVTGKSQLVEEKFPSTRVHEIKPVFKNIAVQLKTQLPQDINILLKHIVQVASLTEENVYLVGGLVRDILMGNNHKDIDLIVEKDGIEFAKKLSKKIGGSFYSHGKFKTSVINTPTRDIDVATLRREYYHVPAALPEVKKGDLRQDLYRRDFTINAMAVQIAPESEYGKLIDYFGGMVDISNKKIRILYPLSFVEDPTRIFRAIRFSQRFGFDLTGPTVRQLKKTVRMDIQDRLTSDRIKDEILLIIKEKESYEILKRLYGLEGLGCISKELKISGKVYENLRNYDKKLEALPRKIRTEIRKAEDKIKLLIIFSLVSKKEGIRILKKFNFSNKMISAFTMQKRYNQKLSRLISNKLTPGRIFKSLNFLPRVVSLCFLFTLRSKIGINNIVKYLNELSYIKPEITGNELIDMGFPPSPYFSRILFTVRIAKINGRLSGLKDEIKFIRANFFLPKS